MLDVAEIDCMLCEMMPVKTSTVLIVVRSFSKWPNSRKRISAWSCGYISSRTGREFHSVTTRKMSLKWWVLFSARFAVALLSVGAISTGLRLVPCSQN